MTALAVLALVSTGTLAACSADQPASDGVVKVVAALYPLQWLAEQVAGHQTTSPQIEVTSLTPSGAEPHELELSPAQVAQIRQADLVVYISGLQPAVDQAVAETKPSRVIDAASLGGQLVERNEKEAAECSPPDPSNQANPGTCEAPLPDQTTPSAATTNHSKGTDLHIWLDPDRLIPVAEAIGQALAEIRPDAATTFATTTAATKSQLTDLSQAFATNLATCQIKTLAVSHAAYGYLASRYGLTQVAAGGLDPEAEVSPARLRQVTDQLKQGGVRTVFYETGDSDAIAQSLAELAGGLQTAPLDSLERGDPDQTYLDRMHANLDALTQAQACQ